MNIDAVLLVRAFVFGDPMELHKSICQNYSLKILINEFESR